MARPGSLIKLGGAFAKRIRGKGRTGGKLPKWFDSSGRMIRRTEEAASQASEIQAYIKGVAKKGTRVEEKLIYRDPVWQRYKRGPKKVHRVEGEGKYETIPIFKKGEEEPVRYIKKWVPGYHAHGQIEFSTPDVYQGPKPSYFRRGTAEVVSNPTRKLIMSEEYLEKSTMNLRFKKPTREKIRDSGEIVPYSYKERESNPRVKTLGMYENPAIRRSIGGRSSVLSKTVHTPDPVLVRKKTGPSRTQAALYALRQIEKGQMAPQAQRAKSPGVLNQPEARGLVDQFEAPQEQVMGRLQERLFPGTEDETMVPKDYPYMEAMRRAGEQAALPEAERTQFPYTWGVPSVTRLQQGPEGPKFTKMTWKQVGGVGEDIGRNVQREIGEEGKAYKGSQRYGSQFPITSVEDLNTRVTIATMMWKAMRGAASMEGRMWKRQGNRVLKRNMKSEDMTNQDAMDAFIKVAKDFMQDPERARKVYPKMLVESVENSYKLYQNAKAGD